MGPIQDMEVAVSAPTRLSFGVFFFYINLIIVHKKRFYTYTHKKKTK